MMKITVLLPDVMTTGIEIEREIFGPEADIILGQAIQTDAISDKIWTNCDAVLAWDNMEYNAMLIKKLVKCKVIVRVGVGFDNVDLAEAKKSNIVVCNVPDYGTGEVADHAMSLLLSFSRGLPLYTERVKRRDWARHNDMTFRLDQSVMGIIGLGRIGTATAMRAKSFGMKVVFYDPYINDGLDKALGITRADTLNEIAENADVISLHVPLTHETKDMLNEEFFNQARKNPVIINTARGSVIKLPDLEEAMREGRVRAAGLDVLPVEPSDNSQQLIVDWENDEEWIRGRLIVTPHSAFYSPTSIVEIRKKACLEALRVVRGEKARNCVNAFYD